MNTDPIAAVQAVEVSAGGNLGVSGVDAGGVNVETMPLGYSAGFTSDAGLFADSMSKAEAANGVTALEGGDTNAVMRAMIEPLDYINKEATALIEYAESAVASGEELSPSEIVMLTAKSQEFMFHSQLTSNVANRTADGLQQLFRQQS